MLTTIGVVMLLLWLFGYFGKGLYYIPVVHDHGWFHTFLVVALIVFVLRCCFGMQ